MNLKDLLKLAGEQGKVVIVGEDGEIKGVLVSHSDYSKSNPAFDKPVPPVEDPEKVNRAILEAQLKDNMDLSGGSNLETIEPDLKMPEPISQILQDRARNLFVARPAPALEDYAYDPREEVVDPKYGRVNAPLVSVDQEEIKPNFDDI